MGVPGDDYFIDFLMEGTTFYDPLAVWTKPSMSATVYTEGSQSATSWTQREA